MAKRTPERKAEEATYRNDHQGFLDEYPICPVTGGRTTQIHHSAKREGLWLLLKRYWIAVSLDGHRYIENNKNWAATVGLMVRIREPYFQHVKTLEAKGLSLTRPIFYESWDGSILKP